MSRSYFEETQVLRENRWVWIALIVIASAALLPLIYGLYWQLGMGEPWGDKPMTDQGIIFLFLFILFTVALLFWILLSLKLEVKIDQEGLHYRFFPNKPRWSLITKDEIVSFQVRKRYNLFESGGRGYHRNWFRKTKSMSIHGYKNLLVTLKNGEKIMLGTRDPEGIEIGMKKLMNKNDLN